MHEVVPSAVKNAVSAATITFTANSIIRCFFKFSQIVAYEYLLLINLLLRDFVGAPCLKPRF